MKLLIDTHIAIWAVLNDFKLPKKAKDIILQSRKSKYKAQIDKIYKYASEMLPKINRVFANYMGHGIEHSVNVMQYVCNQYPK